MEGNGCSGNKCAATIQDHNGEYENGNGKQKIRVWCDGCFDLVHYGHANSLRQAKLLGDQLVVGVHNDADITKFKGPPVFTEQERYKMVRAIKWVDAVVEGSTYWPTVDTLKKHNCDFATHGDDISVATNGQDPYSSLKEAGVLKIYKRTEGISTTDIVGRMLLLTKEHHSRQDVGKPAADTFVYSKDSNGRGPWTRVSQFLQTSNKIVQFSEGREPKPGDRIVYVSGDWDVLHPGHVDFLEAARKEGDYLIVGVHSDQDINQLKGGNYPILNLHERTLSVLACRYVSEVIIEAPYSVSEDLINQFNISLVIHGWTATMDENGVDWYTIPKKLGIFKTIDTGNHLTTNDIVHRIIEHRLEYELRNRKKENREKLHLSNNQSYLDANSTTSK